MNKFVKAIALIAVVAFVLAGFVGCGGKQTWSDENVVFSYDENGDPVITFPDNFEYPESWYGEFGFDTNGDIEPYDFYERLDIAIRHKRISSIFLVKIINKLSVEEAEKLEHYVDYPPDNYSTFYEAILVYDYLREKELNEPIIYRSSYRDDSQKKGYPPYEPGDCFVSLLSSFSDNYNIVNAVVIGEIFVLKSDTVTLDTYAYTQGFNFDVLNNYSEKVAEEKSLVKSAFEKNPRRLYQKLTIRDFVEFIKEKFTEVGYEVK